MDLTVVFETTPRLIMASYRACHRTSYVGIRIMCALILVAGILLQSPLFVIMPVVLVAASEYGIRRQLRAYLGEPRTVTVTMTEEEYRVSSPDRFTARSWSTFSKVSRRGDFWVLRISWAAAMALPVTAFSGDQTAVFVDLLRRKNLMVAPDPMPLG